MLNNPIIISFCFATIITLCYYLIHKSNKEEENENLTKYSFFIFIISVVNICAAIYTFSYCLSSGHGSAFKLASSVDKYPICPGNPNF